MSPRIRKRGFLITRRFKIDLLIIIAEAQRRLIIVGPCLKSCFDTDAATSAKPCSVSAPIATVDSATVATFAGSTHASNRDAPLIGAISEPRVVERHTGYASLPIAAVAAPA